MSNFQTLSLVTGGNPGTAPRIYSAVTSDSLATLVAVGYLNDLSLTSFNDTPVKANDYFLINYLDTGSSSTFDTFQVVVSGSNYSLIPYGVSVLGSTVVNHLALFANTSGQIKEGPLFYGAPAAVPGGAAAQVFADAQVTTSSIVVASVATITNAVYLRTVLAGAGNITFTFSADPGASNLNYFVMNA